MPQSCFPAHGEDGTLSPPTWTGQNAELYGIMRMVCRDKSHNHNLSRSQAGNLSLIANKPIYVLNCKRTFSPCGEVW